MKKKLRTVFLICFAVLFAALCVPASAPAADAKEVELKFDGRPKVGETYVISVNSRQVRTYRMKLSFCL